MVPDGCMPFFSLALPFDTNGANAHFLTGSGNQKKQKPPGVTYIWLCMLSTEAERKGGSTRWSSV